MNFFDIIAYEGMIVISNKDTLKPAAKVVIKRWNGNHGWGEGIGTDSGYSFAQFLADTYHCLGENNRIEGMQQLIHHYYLKIGDMDAPSVAARIKGFLSCNLQQKE